MRVLQFKIIGSSTKIRIRRSCRGSYAHALLLTVRVIQTLTALVGGTLRNGNGDDGQRCFVCFVCVCVCVCVCVICCLCCVLVFCVFVFVFVFVFVACCLFALFVCVVCWRIATPIGCSVCLLFVLLMCFVCSKLLCIYLVNLKMGDEMR